MKISLSLTRLLTLVSICAAGLCAVGAAHADLKSVQTMSMDLSKITINGQPLTDAQLKMMKNMPMFQSDGSVMTVYMKGTKSRVEMTGITNISDYAAKQSMLLDTVKKTYYIQKLDPAAERAGNNVKATVTDLGTTQVLLGHTCEGYDMTMQMQGMTYDCTMWTTTDIQVPGEAFKFGNPQVDSLKDKLKGFPLKMDGKMTSPIFGQASMTWVVKSISTEPIDDSEFTVPADYTKVDKPTAPTGWGGQ